jgi:hypothetical protein
MIAVGAAITTITVQNTTASAQSNVPITFGQVFAVGDLPAAGAAVELRAPDNTVVQCQLDAKVNHADGSLRHGILSAIIPALAASASVTYSIVRKAAPITGAAPVPADFAGLNATVLLTDTGTDLAGPTAGTDYTADAAARLAAGTYETWLSGPIVSEWLVRVPLLTAGGVEHPDQHVRVNIRAYAGQAKAKIDYIVENNWAKPKTVPSGTTPWEDVSIAPRIYAFSLKAGNTIAHTRAVNGHTRTRLTFNGNGVYDGNATGLANDATVYTATITADGVEKPISITGSAAQTFGQLRALFNTQLGGAATCSADKGMLGLIFESATTGAGSSVVIAYGTLFPALSHPVPYRPVRGDEVVHYPGTRWKKTFWWGTEPTVHIAHDKTYLMASKAVPNYAPDLTGTTATITANLAAMKANEDIGQNGITKAYMGDVGYAPGIGILPEWTAMYLVNQGADAKYIMLKQADLLGSWPIHVRDYATDQPISFEKWPYATFSVNAGDSRNAATGLNEKLPTAVIPAAIPDNRNRPDTAHHPDFCFVPYLVTGDHYYMEGLLFYHRYLGLNTNAHAAYRDGRKCLWRADQVRGQAWSLRTSAHARYITPDGHTLRADIEYTMAENALWYEANYLAPAAPYQNNFGAIIHGSGLAYTTPGGASTGGSPWMDDFVTAACGRAVELGYAEYLPLLTFKAKNIAGRLISGVAFCWQLATTYALRYKESAAGALYTNWNEVYIGSLPASITSEECGSAAMATAISAQLGYTIQQNAMSGYPATISGYPASMQPAIAYCATYDTAGGDDAWTVFDGRAQKPDYNLGPQFAIVPRAAVAGAPTPAPPDPTPTPPPIGVTTMTIADRVKDTTTTTGTGAFALAGAPEMNFRPFLTAPIVVGSVVPYSAVHRTLPEWEDGFGTLSAALTLVRTTVTASSNNNQPVPFSDGIKDVSCDLTAEFMKRFASPDSASVASVANAEVTSVLIVDSGVVKQIPVADLIAEINVASAEIDYADAGFDIVLCAGQSNMEGNPAWDPLIDVGDPRVYQWANSSADAATYRQVLAGADPLFMPSGVRTGKTGPATWFAKSYLTTRPTNRLVLLVPVAVGSTGLVGATWAPGNPGGTYYERAITESNLAIAAALLRFPKSRFVGTIWAQGEADGLNGTTQNQYAAGLKNVIAGFRARITGAANSWFVISGMTPEGIVNHTGEGVIDLAHKQVAAEVDRVTFVPGVTGMSSDVHYTSPGIRIMGSRLGLAAQVAAKSKGSDVTVPAVTGASVANATPTLVVLALTENLDPAYVPTAAAFSVSGHIASAVAFGNLTLTLTVNAFINGETQTASYTPPGGNAARDIAGNLLAGFTGLAITNSVQPSDLIAPTLSSAQIANAAPSNIVLTFSETLGAFTPAAAAFTLSSGRTVTGVARSGATITSTVSAPYVNGDVENITYTKPGSNPIQDAAGNQTATFGPSAVTNNVGAVATAPAQMAAPTATATGATTADVVLVAPADGGSPITGYTVVSNPAGGVDTDAGTTDLTHNITGLTAGVAYTFTATAANAVGVSPASAASSSVTPAAAGAGFTTFSATDKEPSLNLSNGNLTVSATATGFKSARGAAGKTAGKWYWEVKLTAGTSAMVGFGSATVPLTNFVGNDAPGQGYGYYTNGSRYYKNAATAQTTWTTNDVIGVAIDLDAKTFQFFKNGVGQGSLALAADFLLGGAAFPIVTTNGSTVVLVANFGATAFAFAPPVDHVGFSV